MTLLKVNVRFEPDRMSSTMIRRSSSNIAASRTTIRAFPFRFYSFCEYRPWFSVRGISWQKGIGKDVYRHSCLMFLTTGRARQSFYTGKNSWRFVKSARSRIQLISFFPFPPAHQNDAFSVSDRTDRTRREGKKRNNNDKIPAHCRNRILFRNSFDATIAERNLRKYWWKRLSDHQSNHRVLKEMIVDETFFR